MVETQVISSLLSQWLTPTSLFILLNIVLATILLRNNHQQSKKRDNNNDNRNEDGASLVPPPPQLTRAPSLFSRVASFNFSNYYSESPAAQSDETSDHAAVTVTRAPSLLYRVTSFNFCRAPREAAADGEGNKVNDVKETHSSNEKTLEREVHEAKEENDVKVKKVNKKKKVKKAEVVAVEEVKEEKETTTTTTSFRGEDAQVDSKADDFINKFKQNLKMQRLDSLLRYRNYNTVADN